MPYANHPVFEEPPGDAPLWRYTDFTKFVSLLDTKALFFSRADLLGDPFEGSYTPINQQRRPEWAEEHGLPMEAVEGMSDALRLNPQGTFINAWHWNDVESAAMWSLYLRSEEGIAVRSTFSRLCDAVAAEPRDIFIGLVTYIDYDVEPIPEGNIFWPFVHKRKSYAHETEVRAVIHDFELVGNIRARMTPQARAQVLEARGIADTPDLDLDEVLPLPAPGLHVPVDLDTLIESVYVSPSAADWFTALVESVMRRYGHNQSVVHSALGSDPVY